MRNPWISPQSYALKLDAETDLSPQANGLSAVSLYPENRIYAKQLKFGDTLTIPLAPYETVVLAIGPEENLAAIPDVCERIGNGICATGVQSEVHRVEFLAAKKPDGPGKSTEAAGLFGPDWTATLGHAKRSLELRLEAIVSLASTQGELLVLSEEKSQPIPPQCRLLRNGKDVRATMSGPDLGYSGTVLPRPEQWLFAIPACRGEEPYPAGTAHPQRVAQSLGLGMDNEAGRGGWIEACQLAPAAGNRVARCRPDPGAGDLGGPRSRD